MKRSKCVCADCTVTKEDKPGDYYDPDNRLIRHPDGCAYRVLHFGCPAHNGNSYRRIPADLFCYANRDGHNGPAPVIVKGCTTRTIVTITGERLAGGRTA